MKICFKGFNRLTETRLGKHQLNAIRGGSGGGHTGIDEDILLTTPDEPPPPKKDNGSDSGSD